MGYDLYITRNQFWAEADGPPITKEEWDEYLCSDPEIVPDPDNGRDDYIFLRAKGQPPETWPLWWNAAGYVHCTNPPPDVVAKMVQISRFLSATVQGDDGESYGFSVELVDAGTDVVRVMKLVREITGLSPSECKSLVSKAPVVIRNSVSNLEADALRNRLQQAGAVVAIRK